MYLNGAACYLEHVWVALAITKVGGDIAAKLAMMTMNS